VLYWVGDQTIDAEELRSYLGERLPEHMVPSAYVRMDALPLTLNGKVDRRALPVPQADAYVRRRYEAPMGNVEKTLAEIWSQVLSVERVSRHDNFFQLGGHSLLALKLVQQMRRRGLHSKVGTVFTAPTLAALAEAAANAGNGSHEVAVPANRIPQPKSGSDSAEWLL
jgi:aryl carrier-like protein